MSLTTEQRLANTRLMCRPQIIELLDMGEATHQKVLLSVLLAFVFLAWKVGTGIV